MKFKTKKELFDYLVLNKESLIASKVYGDMKKADAFAAPIIHEEVIGQAEKANQAIDEDVTQIKVKAVINTTNLMDGHYDVHLPGLWTKSLKESKRIMHLQEHEMKFSAIISDRADLKAYTKTMTWKELGFDYEGETQALIFESTVKATRNKYMFDQYKAGNVDNHSVGMRYVKIDLAINDKDYPEEYSIWKKYIDKVANKEMAEEVGYFWPVFEAKVIEGSAVPAGSNWITPTLENNMKQEPADATPESPKALTSEEIINRIKNF